MEGSENNLAGGTRAGADDPREETEMVKESEKKEDGRYIIFYAFEDEGEEDRGEDAGEGSTS